jgi:hypothetical protein
MENTIFDLDAFFERIHYKDGAQTAKSLSGIFTLPLP